MKYDSMILGENVEFSMNSRKTGINNNVIVVGGSGCGKTCSYVEPNLHNLRNSSAVVTVTKRKIVNKYKKTFKKRGYNVFDLNFAEPEKSNVSWDPPSNC